VRATVILLIFLLLAVCAHAATFTCTIQSGTSCSSGTLLIRLNSSEAGAAPNNSHAQLANESGTLYPYSVCCSTDAFRTLTNTCAATATQVLKLYDTTNSHVQAGTQAGYGFGACLNVTSGNITCEYPTSACSAGYNGVVSMASSEAADNNLTNAHVGDFNFYSRKVCCQIGGQTPPVGAYANISPNMTATTRDDLYCLNGSVTDADGDSVTLHYNWYRNGTSITVLNLPMDYDSNTGTTHDISGFANHGTVNGATFLPTNGRVGGAFNFSGSNKYITLPNDPELNFETNAFTISVWVKVPTVATQSIIDKKNGSGSASPGFILYASNIPRFIIHNGTSSLQVLGEDPITDNIWHHIVAVRNSSGIYLYLDSSLSNSVAGGETWNLSNAIVPTIGANSSLADMFFTGNIDELMIFNRSLTAGEIQALYNLNNQVKNGTRRNEAWNCSITPVDSTGLNGTTKYSNQTLISGSPPLQVTLLYPANNNNTVFERYVNFSWSGADERDGDTLNHTLNLSVQPGTCSVQLQQSNIPGVNYTYGELCTDQYYNWSVRVCDIDGCSSWSTQFNFTIASVLSINLLDRNTDFGTLNVLQSKDTETGGITPFRIENDGNVLANITANATGDLFTTAGLGSTAFQFKARQNETGAFNTSGSQLSYTPVDSILKNVLKQLNYSDTNDSAYVDINITVPSAEQPGTRTTNVTFRATVSG
jgi:hypothetical protein